MGMINGIRTINAIVGGTMSGSALETYLTASGNNLGSFLQLMNLRGQMMMLAQSSTAMTAVIASSTAMTAVAASSTAMTAVWALNTASTAVMSSSTARLAVYNSDTALAALQAAPSQVQNLVTSLGVTSTTAAATANLVSNGTKIIILRRWYSGTEFDYINWSRGSVTSGAGNGPTAGSGGRTLYTAAQALGCTSGTYTSNGTMPLSNDYTGNFVCAANGLRRDTWYNSNVQNVIYIAV